jgi:predicted TIM-barrel fold metal-dependent hydrolase
METQKIISSDSHIFEPPDLWVTRVDSKFRDRAPKLVNLGEGGDWWVCEGKPMIPASGASQVGRRFTEPEKLTRVDSIKNVPRGAFIPEEHVKDMQIDGVYASVLYPTVGLGLYTFIADSELLNALFPAYNDWMAEFCKPFPRQLKGVAMINLDDIALGVKEMERCAKIGLAGAMISVYPVQDRPYDSPDYDPVWAAAQDLGLPLSQELSDSRDSKGGGGASPAFFVNIEHWVRMSLAQMIFSGVFERFPKLQVGSVEMEASWSIHFLDRIDDMYKNRIHDVFKDGYWSKSSKKVLPSEYFHRNIFVSFQEDAAAIRERQYIGVDNLVWGSDYPHPESTFPRTRQILADILKECTAEERAKIIGGNAARLYQFN